MLRRHGDVEGDLELDELCQSDEEDADLYVVDDTDESDADIEEGAVKAWLPVRKKDKCPLKECLQLSFEEVGYLTIVSTLV